MFSKMVILIPVYNPRERIINYVKKLKEKNYDVVVINDGSDENYHAVFERMVYDCKIINYPHFKGKGYALKKGYQYVKEHLKDKKGILILENEYDLKLVDQIMRMHLNSILCIIKGKRFYLNYFHLFIIKNLSMSTVNCLAFQYLI